MSVRTGQSMVAPLLQVVVKSPMAAGASDWELAGWHSAPHLPTAEAEHAALCSVLAAAGADVVALGSDGRTGADSIYVHDPCLATDDGVLMLTPGKPSRRAEAPALADALAGAGIPIAGSIEWPATVEGGDLVWLDRRTLLVGRSLRTNAAGVAALRTWFAPRGVTVVEVPLPWGDGPAACLHLMSLMSLLDDDLAVVHRPLLPVPLVERLLDAGVQLVDIAADEYDTQACNVLALAPRDMVMLAGNERTAERLEAVGCRVRLIDGAEMSRKGDGGPTCLTRPVWRRS